MWLLLTSAAGADGTALAAIGLIAHLEALAAVALPFGALHAAVRAGVAVLCGGLLVVHGTTSLVHYSTDSCHTLILLPTTYNATFVPGLCYNDRVALPGSSGTAMRHQRIRCPAPICIGPTRRWRRAGSPPHQPAFCCFTVRSK